MSEVTSSQAERGDGDAPVHNAATMFPSFTTANIATPSRKYSWLNPPPASFRDTQPSTTAGKYDWSVSALASFQIPQLRIGSRFFDRGIPRWTSTSNTQPHAAAWGPGTLPGPVAPVPWLHWSAATRELVEREGPVKFYEMINSRQITHEGGIMRHDHGGWFIETRPEDHAKGSIFLPPVGTASLLECERCFRVFNHKMRPVYPLGDPAGYETFQASFALCPFNKDGQCHERQGGLWKMHQSGVEVGYHATAKKTIEALSLLDPKQLIRSVFGDHSYFHGENELLTAYKALRIIWIRAFPALRPNLPEEKPGDQSKDAPPSYDQAEVDQTNSSGSNSPLVYHEVSQGPKPDAPKPQQQSGHTADPESVELFHQFGGLKLWGEIDFDLKLLAANPGLLEEKHLAQVYGMSAPALRYMRLKNWLHEMEWLNAYAGIRHHVRNDHYMLMRTACQRASTAMDRVLQAVAMGARILPEAEKTYAHVGRRFHELLSALCADMEVARAGLRAIDQPLRADLWKKMSRVWAGRRVDPLLVT